MVRKDLLDLASLERQEVEEILDQAIPFKDLFQRSVKKVPALKGKTVLMLFYEPSTRTLSSFEVAAKRLSADVTVFDVPHSSVVKGESVKDTIDTLQAMQADYIVVRHQMPGLPGRIARMTGASVVSAGDGAHAHPTQGLLDAFTLREIYPESGKKVLIVGDIRHSRVARSTSTVFRKLGYEVAFLGPGSLVPDVPGIKRFTSFDEAWRWNPDVVYLLRVQKERQGAQYYPSVGEYHKLYGVTEERFRLIADEGKWVMHPGPVNRGVELCDAVMDYERTLINRQVENGIAVRMAVLYLLKPKLARMES
ncbi:MAG: aspartate carbamoyltransferase catalytic subunit [Verrucomicrobiota bacterium JB023]|nr:aspartate carbamoyltransferase catalytic subunit [Verrucomicrobiota bacterium JB023]